jgi:hypothetical protein
MNPLHLEVMISPAILQLLQLCSYQGYFIGISLTPLVYGQRRAKHKTGKLVQDLSIKTEQNTERSEQRAAS